MHRNLVLNEENATAWYWLFNEWKQNTITKEVFVEEFHSFLSVNGMKIKKQWLKKSFTV